jgi:hypothetical protein
VQPDYGIRGQASPSTIATAMEKGSIHFEWMHKRADSDATFAADVLLTPIALDDKPSLQAVVRDVTERKRTEAELQQVPRRAGAAHRRRHDRQRLSADARRRNCDA